MPGKKILGVTGSFGAGKSTVVAILAELGAGRVDADRLAHEALQADSPVHAEICAAFPGALGTDGRSIDTRRLSDLVFDDPEKRRRLEALIHPYVFGRIADEVAGSTQEVVAVEVPLLFETGFERMCFKTIVVNVSESVVLERLRGKGFQEKEILLRRKAQMPPDEKMRKADLVIHNDGDRHKTRREVEKMWEKLQPDLKGAA